MSLTVAELKAVYSVDEGPLDKSLSGIPGKVNKVRPGQVKIDGDDTGLQRAVGSSEKSTGRLTSSLRTAAAATAGYFAFDAVKYFIGGTITAASDLNETVNKSNVIFGANAAVVNDWAKGAARNMGLSRQQALEAAAGFGDMFSQIGFAGDEAAKLSMRVVQMSADLGSFNNLPTAEVSDRISAAFRGEYDSLQALIPNINAARVEQEAMAATGKKNAAELTAQEKAAAVLAIVQKDGARAMGDFARTADGLANSQKTATGQWLDAKAALGEKLLPAMTAVVQFTSSSLIPAFGGIVDIVGNVVGVFADLPGPVQAALVTLAAVVALKGPLGDFFGMLPAKITGLVTSIGMATTTMGGFKAAAGGVLGFFGGPWGLAITGAVAGLSLLVSWLGSSDEATQETTQATQDYAAALRESKGAIDANVRAAAAKAAQDAGLLGIADQLGIKLSQVTDAITGNGGAYDAVRQQLETYIATQTRTVVSGRTSATVLTEEGEAAQDALDALGGLAGQVGKTGSEQEQLATATESSDVAMASAQTTAEQLATKLQDSADAASAAKKQTDLLKLSLDMLTGKHVDMIQVETAFYDAVRDAEGALKDLDGTVLDAAGNLNTHSEAGSKTSDVLIDIADSANTWISTMITQGATADQVAARDAELRKSFYDTALQMTGSKQAAERLTNQIYGIPAERETQIRADTKQATDAVTGLRNLLAGIHDRVVNITARATLPDLNGWVSGNGRMGSYAFGGYTGDGGRNEVAGLVHRGEFVIPQESVRRIGLDNLRSFVGASGTQLTDMASQQALGTLTVRRPAGVGGGSAAAGAGGQAGAGDLPAGGVGELVHIDTWNDYSGSSPQATAAALSVEWRTR